MASLAHGAAVAQDLDEPDSLPLPENTSATTFDLIHLDFGHRFGNFHNYYSFHNVEDRLGLLTDELIASWLDEAEGDTFSITDVGSNEGTLTRELHDMVVRVASIRGMSIKVRTLGMELDPVLVDRARINYGNSHMTAEKEDKGHHNQLCFEAVDCTDSSKVASAVSKFLGNEQSRFNLVTCFSTTMWVHVNHGDEALVAFLSHLADLSTRLIIEPQPWRCYRQAATRLRRQGKPVLKRYAEVASRSDKVIESFIISIVCKAGSTMLAASEAAFTCTELSEAAGSWKRKVLLFQRH